jgi:NTE family protein
MNDISWRPSGAGHPRKLALALQGGGAHGALAWGVLDRLLEDEELDIVGVSGSGAGAVNAVALADGLLRGGREQARQALREVWEALGDTPGFGALLFPLAGELQAQIPLELTPHYQAWDLLSRSFTPADLNPFNVQPMRAPLEQLVDFERLRAAKDFPVMVCATHVLSGRRRAFANAELCVDAVLASACRAQILPAVNIEGEPYWEGALSGGPALAEFIPALPACDLVLLRSEPLGRTSLPSTPREIQDRAMEISSSSAAWLELSALAVILRLEEDGWLDRERFGRIRIHSLDAGAALETIAASSRLNYAPAFLAHLFDMGRTTADGWLAANHSALGERSTLDLQSLLPVSSDAFKRRDPAYTPPARTYAEAVRPRIKLYSPEPR